MAWLKASCLVVVYLITSFLFVYAQIDPQLCPDGAITVLDPKWPSISTSFELFAELTSNAGSSNIVQTLGNGRDIIIETANGGNFHGLSSTVYKRPYLNILKKDWFSLYIFITP